jgi:hypothetical protein
LKAERDRLDGLRFGIRSAVCDWLGLGETEQRRAGLPHSLGDVARVLGDGSEEKLMLDIVADIERRRWCR